ncbi:lantibiotic dehydratase C-terminal domain-containing protein [Kitasatospora sp. MBT63]|uniref:lantibiotic dehydratase C-terminal domain-containing protein n=1 Tax=Kitasatospora sp. MBT63 TaxID=1444768 RepID=UPI00068B8993|nr:lantibiotic dehydratase C-terminal domain-containing protein [Kitasatospora sp. MBT63]
MTAPTPSTADLDDPAGPWQALHVFYAANPRPLLLQCVHPLIRSLRDEQLLSGYFFINYWLEGPHVRLRLKPATPDATDEIRHRARHAVDDFLRARPALYDVEASGFRADMYNTLFGLEYPDKDQEQLKSPDGRMRLRPNNTASFEPYEPEYGKYGGPAGVALAEWHFEHSSDLVIGALATLNLHLRTVTLGTAAQLMLVMAASFLRDREDVIDYLDSYHRFWHTSFAGTDLIGGDEYESGYARLPTGADTRFEAMLDAIRHRETHRLPATLRDWAAHCRELAQRATDLAHHGELVFRSRDGSRDQRITDPDEALLRLLFPYMHMTNNRLHMTIRDEAYLSYVLYRTLQDHRPPRPTTGTDRDR